MANILDLDPFAFAAALEELQLPEEDAARLREQYRQKQSPFAGAKEALKPEEGRNTSDILPVSVPEGMSIAEGITSGNWDWAVPEGLSGGATAALEGIEAPGQIASGVPFSEQELQDAAWKTAGAGAAGSLTAPVPEGATRMFGGKNAVHFPAESAKDAARMHYRYNANPDLIWEDTGVEFVDNGMRPIFQIDPANAKFEIAPPVVKQNLEEFFVNNPDQTSASIPLKQILSFDDLYKNYPELSKLKVVFGRDDDALGSFDARNRVVFLDKTLLDDPEEMRSVLLHELQHGIQASEGTSGGASARYFFRLNPETNTWESPSDDPQLKPFAEELNKITDEYWDEVDEFGDNTERAQTIKDRFNEVRQEALRLAFKKYQTNSGEVEARAAQLWDQLSPEEKRTTKPSDIFREALGLLEKEGYGPNYMPTSRFAEGGMVQEAPMEQDMTKLFAEGGINTGDVEVDPVSGNEVPPGSLPEEVRDDVDAKLSGGEYVVPADVLRYYGVSFFEKLRKKAKEGLAEMDAEGRIGGDKAPEEGMTEGPEAEEEGDDLPFDEDELMYEEEDDMEFAAGGMVPGQAAFNPNQFYAGFSAFGDAPQQQIENRTYVSASGQRMSIQFINGQPQQAIPAGFYPEGQLPPSATNPTQPSAPVGGQNERPNADPQRSKTRENTEQGFDWAKGKDFKNMSATEAAALANSRLEAGKVGSGIAQGVGSLLSPILGGVAGGAMKMRPVAEINGIERHLRSIGNTEAADAVAAIGDKYVAERGIGLRALENVIAPGTQVAKTLASMQGQAAPQATGKTGGSAAGRTIVKDGDKSGGTGKAKGTISGPVGGNSQKKGVSPAPSKPAPSKPAPARSAPAKSSGGQKASQRGGGRFKEGGLIERRKK